MRLELGGRIHYPNPPSKPSSIDSLTTSATRSFHYHLQAFAIDTIPSPSPSQRLPVPPSHRPPRPILTTHRNHRRIPLPNSLHRRLPTHPRNRPSQTSTSPTPSTSRAYGWARSTLSHSSSRRSRILSIRRRGPELRAEVHRGWVINLCSVLGSAGLPGASCYCLSKGAVLQLTRS